MFSELASDKQGAGFDQPTSLYRTMLNDRFDQPTPDGFDQPASGWGRGVVSKREEGIEEEMCGRGAAVAT